MNERYRSFRPPLVMNIQVVTSQEKVYANVHKYGFWASVFKTLMFKCSFSQFYERFQALRTKRAATECALGTKPVQLQPIRNSNSALMYECRPFSFTEILIIKKLILKEKLRIVVCARLKLHCYPAYLGFNICTFTFFADFFPVTCLLCFITKAQLKTLVGQKEASGDEEHAGPKYFTVHCTCPRT